MSTTITFLGTGSGMGGGSRNKSSLLVRGENRGILIDAGEPCAEELLNLGLGHDALKTVFISHGHADHIAGLPMIIQTKQVGGRKEPLDIYLPQNLIQPLADWLQALDLSIDSLLFPLHLHPLEDGKPQTSGDWKVTPFATSHDNQNGRQSFGFAIQTGASRLVVSGDLGGAQDLEAALSTPTDVLVCELAHLTTDDLAKTLATQEIRLLLLVHLAPSLLEQSGNILRELDRKLPEVDEIFLPGDGETFPLEAGEQ